MTIHFDPVAHRFTEGIWRAPPDCDAAFRTVCLRDNQLRRTPARSQTAR